MDITVLAGKAAEGDSDAFVKLVKQLEGSLYYMARSLLGKEEDIAFHSRGYSQTDCDMQSVFLCFVFCVL